MSEETSDWIEKTAKEISEKAGEDPEYFRQHMALTQTGLEQAWKLVQDKLALFADLLSRTEVDKLQRTEEGEIRIPADDYKVLHEIARMVVQEASLRVIGRDKPEQEE